MNDIIVKDKVVIEDLPNGASEDTCLRDNTDEGSIEICKYADMAIENGYNSIKG